MKIKISGKVLGVEDGIAVVLVAIGDDVQIVRVPVGMAVNLPMPKKESTSENPQV